VGDFLNHVGLLSIRCIATIIACEPWPGKRKMVFPVDVGREVNPALGVMGI
jgi:hypothetical protein